MKKFQKIFAIICALTLIICSVPMSAIATTAADVWDGTSDTSWFDSTDVKAEYTLTTAEQLAGLAVLVNEGNTFKNTTVKLDSDLDLENKEWVPIGNASNKFSGNFDGQENVINNLTINGSMDYDNGTGTHYVGLFGYVNNGGYIKNITIENAKITGCLYVGGLVGRVYIGGAIENCHIKGAVSVAGYWYVGGIVGRYEYADGIKNCSVIDTNHGQVIADTTFNSDKDGSYVGGIVGFVAEDNTKIVGCTVNNMNVSGLTRVGGITGIAHYGNTVENNSVINVFAYAGDTGMVGIIAGSNQGGQNSGANKVPSYVINNVIIGSAAYANGEEVTNLSGTTISGTKPTSTVVGTDIVLDENGKVTAGNVETATGDNIADGYEVAEDGTVAVDTAIYISTPDELIAFANQVNGGDSFEGKIVRLKNDIDMLSYQGDAMNIVPIGTKTAPFKGTFDGKGYTINNFTVWNDTLDYVGLFGFTTEAAIKNVTLNNPYLVGRSYVAGIVGCAYTGSVENCHVTGEIDIEGNYMVGGITGHGYAKIADCSVIGDANWDYSVIMATYLESDIEGDNVGGIVGHKAENTTISNCEVANVTVTGTRKIGGIVGTTFQNNIIIGCDVSNITVTTNATEEYASNNAGSMGIGGIVGITSGSYTGGTISDCSVSGVTFIIENDLTTAVSAGAITGGHRGSASPVAPENTTIENNTINTATVSGANNTYGIPAVAKIGDAEYTTLEAAFAAAAEGDTIILLADAAPALRSQRAITKASVIDLGGNTLTLTEDDLYFGTTTFKNGNIVVDSSVKPSTAVFWMFANQTLTFDGVKIDATGVTGTYLIGLDGNNADLNLINGSEIYINNATALDLDVICVNSSSGNDIVIDNSKVNVTNLDGRVFFRGNYVVSGNSDIDLTNITKAGFRIEAGQILEIKDTATVDIVGESRDGGIHITDITAVYTKADTATVNATVNAPKVPSAELSYGPYGAKSTGEAGTESYRERFAVDIYNICAQESLVVKLYSGDTLISTTSLREADRDDETAKLIPMEAKSTTANIIVSGRLAGSWDTVWHISPSVAYMPNKIEVYADDILTDTWKGGFINENEDTAFRKLGAVEGEVLLGGAKYTLADAISAAKTQGLTEVELDVLVDIDLADLNGITFEKLTLNAKNGAKLNCKTAQTINYPNEIIFNDFIIEEDDTWGYNGIQGGVTQTYNNCTINGCLVVYNDNATFNSCTFNQATSNYALYNYACTTLAVNNCIFNVKNRAVKVYTEHNYERTATFIGCEFYAEEAIKAAVEITTEYTVTADCVMDVVINDCTATGFGAAEHVGAESNALWNFEQKANSAGEVVSKGSVTVDDKLIFPEAEPEVTMNTALYYAWDYKPSNYGGWGGNTYSIYMAVGIDSLNYKEGGFEVTIGGETQTFYIDGTVWKEITVKLANRTDNYVASDFGSGNEYIMSYVVTFTQEMKELLKDETVQIRAFLTDFSGNTIYSTTWNQGSLVK